MFSDKLTTLLLQFSKYELNRFRKFLLSPYFNEQEQLLRLFDVCDAAIREGQTALETLSKELVWRSLYGHKKFDDAQLRRLSSELTGLAMKFLAVEANERQPNTEWLSLQSLLEKPELHKHRASVERQLQRYFEEEDTPSSQHLLDQHLMHWNTFNQAAKTFSSGDYADKLEPADFYLECFYLSRKMKLYLAWLSFQNFRSTQVKIELIPGLSDYLAHPRFSRFPLLKVYRQILLSLSEPDEEAHFDHLLEMLEREGGQINREDLRECYHIAQNYCALKINQGKTRYYQLVFRIYQELIASGLLLESGQLSEGAYKNIITISLQVGAYEWAEHFVQTHSAFLPASIRENAHSYNLASLYFHQKKFDRVIELLRSVEYSDVTYSIGAKLLLLRTYYEIDEFMALDSLIDSVRIYLRRNRVIAKTMVREFSNFLNFLKKLSTMDTHNKAELQEFYTKVKNNPAVISKKWLLEKIEHLGALRG